MEMDRRAAPRSPAHLYFNKYIDGVPYLCEALEISMTGMLVRRVQEPDASLACYALELGHPRAPAAEAPVPATDEPPSAEAPPKHDRVWLCATPVWTHGRFEALTFVGQSHLDRLKLADLVSALRGPAVPTRAGASEAVVAEEALDA